MEDLKPYFVKVMCSQDCGFEDYIEQVWSASHGVLEGYIEENYSEADWQNMSEDAKEQAMFNAIYENADDVLGEQLGCFM